MHKGSILTYISVFIIIASIILSGCKRNYTPKPRGYFRIDLPEKEYKQLDSVFPYKFKYPAYAKIVEPGTENSEKYWINIEYPDLNGKVHISYKKVNDNINQIIEDSRKLAYKHSIKANAISETMYANPQRKVYGILYEIEGNAASSLQFFLTDSVNHYLRGALYFNAEPNKDSLAPVVDFVKKDVNVLIESFEWN